MMKKHDNSKLHEPIHQNSNNDTERPIASFYETKEIFLSEGKKMKYKQFLNPKKVKKQSDNQKTKKTKRLSKEELEVKKQQDEVNKKNEQETCVQIENLFNSIQQNKVKFMIYAYVQDNMIKAKKFILSLMKVNVTTAILKVS